MNSKVDEPPYYSRFINGFCIISPSGYRTFARNYIQYTKHMIWHCPNPSKQGIIKHYASSADYEAQLEEQYNLPNEYLLGLCDLYNESAYCKAVAISEQWRLQKRSLYPDYNEIKPHLNLYLVTSLTRNCMPFTDLIKEVMEEKRENCSCYFCCPGIELHPDKLMDENEVGLMERFLKRDARTLNVHIPFRSSQYRDKTINLKPLTKSARESQLSKLSGSKL